MFSIMDRRTSVQDARVINRPQKRDTVSPMISIIRSGDADE